MARRRKPSYRKKSGVFGTPGGFSLPSGGETRESVLAAAEVVCEAVRAKAARFSTRIPAATDVHPYQENAAIISTDGQKAPNAAPFEFGERHPSNTPNNYGNNVWCKGTRRAYMTNGAKAGTAAAAEVYGEREIELLATEYGYTE